MDGGRKGLWWEIRQLMGWKENKKRRRASKEQELGTETSRWAGTAWLPEEEEGRWFGDGFLGSARLKQEDLVC